MITTLDSFKHLGFTSYRAKFLSDFLEAHPVSRHQTVLYWAQEYIQSIFDSSILFSGRPASNDNGHAINYEKSDSNPEDDEMEPLPEIKFTSIEDDDDQSGRLLADYESQSPSSLENTVYWFHGTDEKSAKNIAHHGIDTVTEAKRGADFSDGNGFYVGTSYHFAKEWAKSRPKAKKAKSSAVIVFRLNHNEILNPRKGLVLSENDKKEWEDVIKFFRNRKQDMTRKGRALTKHKYIFGPMSNDGTNSRDKNWIPKMQIDASNQYVYQLCLKDADLAEQFHNNGNHIEEVIIFK